MSKFNSYCWVLFILVANSYADSSMEDSDRGQRTEDRGQKTEDRGQMTPVIDDSFPVISDSFITVRDSFIIIRNPAKEPVYELQPIVITGSRIPTKAPDLTRSVSIITDKEIESLPIYSVSELLNYLVDMRQRNIYGVQADVSIRGSSFEQVLLLVDGVEVADPQTGHHNLDIPVALSDIERIEVLKGQGSAIYGAGAFGGVINIITKKADNDTIEAGGSYGDYNTYTSNIGAGIPVGNFSNRLTVAGQKSAGYRKDSTDFRNIDASFSSAFKDMFNLSVGYLEKDFGAYKFYGPFLSKELTETRFATIGSNLKLASRISIQPKLYYREHYDEFILKRDTPDYYTNHHTNYKYGGEIVGFFNDAVVGWGDAIIGIEAKNEQIKSTGIRSGAEVTALGEHNRQNTAMYAEYRYRVKSFLANVGSRIDYNSLYGTYYSPSLSMGYFLGRVKFRSSVGTSFRAPTFTELYYKDPANIGDSTLKAEQSVSYEVGADYRAFEQSFLSWTQASITCFANRQDNLIDWIKLAGTTAPWRAKNIGKVASYGIEAGIEFREEKVGSFKVDYTFMQMTSELDSGYISKYALAYPEQQVSARIIRTLPLKFEISVSGAFKVRHQESTGTPLPTDRYTVLSAELSKRIGKFSFSITGTNLLDEKYEDIAGVELPSRWLTVNANVGI
ncbi:MAG: TonB-dependent receptor [Candidatus Stahlbacteria bacterium]|nr:TonB-dependent receptor [Candidatus Stahlbacteria bacterium]